MRQTKTVAVALAPGRLAPLLFQSLVVTAISHQTQRRRATFVVSAGVHSAFLSAVVVLPLLLSHSLPGAREVTTFFAPPLEITTLPPPPPVASDGALGRMRVARRVDRPPQGLVAPVVVPTEIIPEEALDPGGGDDPNGVPGGVPGGVVGSILTDLPPQPPPQPPTRVVRISQLQAPRLLRKVAPVYPELAIATHLSATVTLEAEVDTRGHVKSVSVLRGHPLFDEAAIEAVRQWVYRPLLLNGEATGFILTVTIDFNLR